MENKTLVLKLFLDTLGISSDINSVDDRKRVQKAVYLGQLSGVDLGYRYSWYLMGPYCSSLTKDYYALADDLAAGDDAAKGKTLRPDLKANLQKVKSFIEVPDGVDLTQENWLELLASYHFLRKVSGHAKEEAEKLIQEKKPHVAHYTNQAERLMAQVG
jgi:uncharacterized protein YwgA